MVNINRGLLTSIFFRSQDVQNVLQLFLFMRWLHKHRKQVLYPSTSAKAEGSLVVDPSFESQARARHFLAHFHSQFERTSAKYHNLSGLLSQSTWGLLYDWRQSRFSLCTSRNVYQRDPGHGLTFDLRLVARYRDGPIIMVGLCLCRRVKSPHRRAVRPPLESLAAWFG